MVTWQAGVEPEHAPLHSSKADPAAATAESVTAVPEGKLWEQVSPQLIPAGALVTMPPPSPAFATVRVYTRVKRAVTGRAPFMVTWQVLSVPVHAPPHPSKTEPSSAVAERETTVPAAKVASHVPPQSIPAGLLFTVPVPVPSLVRLSECPWRKVAVTLAAAPTVSWQVVPEPVHAPLHPPNKDPCPGMAVRVTTVPLAKVASHADPQSIPAGLLVTDPAPVPDFVTESPWVGTVAEAVPLFPSLVAVIVAVPPPAPVTNPLPLTVATLASLEDQLTVLPVRTLPPASRVAAVNCCVWPTDRVTDEGETATSATGFCTSVVPPSHPVRGVKRHPANATAHRPREPVMASAPFRFLSA